MADQQADTNSLSALTNGGLIVDLDDQLAYHGISVRMGEYTAELRRRLSAGEQAEKELAEALRMISEQRSESDDRLADANYRAEQAEARMAELEASRGREAAAREDAERRMDAAIDRVAELEREYAAISATGEAMTLRAIAAERERDRLRAALKEIVDRHTRPCGVHEVPLPDDVALAETYGIARRALSAGSETEATNG